MLSIELTELNRVEDGFAKKRLDVNPENIAMVEEWRDRFFEAFTLAGTTILLSGVPESRSVINVGEDEKSIEEQGVPLIRLTRLNKEEEGAFTTKPVYVNPEKIATKEAMSSGLSQAFGVAGTTILLSGVPESRSVINVKEDRETIKRKEATLVPAGA